MANSLRYDTTEITSSCHTVMLLIEYYRTGKQIRSECGHVGDRVIDVDSKWQTFDNEKTGVNPCGVGSPENPLLNYSNSPTVIGPGREDASFDDFGVSKYQNRRNINRSDRVNAFREISIIADRINLPRKIVDRANNLFKQVRDGKNLKSRSNDAIASACVYIACRQEGVPRAFNEICAVSEISKKDFGRCFKSILKTLLINVDLTTAEDFTPRFCSNLGLNAMVERAATHIARKAAELDITSGRSPISVAAAAIYMASQASEDKRSQKEIGDIIGVAVGTVSQLCTLMRTHAAKLFPEDSRFETSIDQLPQM
jgi:transcription initiation factor TFIIB